MCNRARESGGATEWRSEVIVAVDDHPLVASERASFSGREHSLRLPRKGLEAGRASAQRAARGDASR